MNDQMEPEGGFYFILFVLLIFGGRGDILSCSAETQSDTEIQKLDPEIVTVL